MSITQGGYLVIDDIACHGCGSTVEAAKADFGRNMREAGIDVLSDEDYSERREAGELGGSFAAAGDFQTVPCTTAMLARIENEGGAGEFPEVGGIYCTSAEWDANA